MDKEQKTVPEQLGQIAHGFAEAVYKMSQEKADEQRINTRFSPSNKNISTKS